jgi:hypothetical protein
MSKYHSICETCGMEDPNDGTLERDCGHPFWAIVEHEGWVVPDDTCGYCLELWTEHTEPERISCERDLENDNEDG